MLVSITSDMFNYSFMPKMEEKFRLFRGFGFEYLHWCDDWANDKKYTRSEMTSYRDILNQVGMICQDVHGTATKRYSIDTSDPDDHKVYIKLLKNRIEFTAFIGGDSVVVHPPNYEPPNLEQRLQRSLEAIDAVRDSCIEHEVIIAIENCSPGDEWLLEKYFETYTPELVGFCYDSGHANINGNFEALKKYRDRLVVTHLHDNRGDTDEHQYPRYGTIDWNDVLKWIGGFYKPLNYEVTHNSDLFKGSMEDFLEATVNSIHRLKST